MKLFLVGDVHWSSYSSILRSRGDRYSTRLEWLLKAVNWAEREAEELGVDKVVYLGDFFDKSSLNSEEIAALAEVEWSHLPHAFIVGNHEASTADLRYNSVLALKNKGFDIISEPKLEEGILYLPYIIETDRKSIGEYLVGSKAEIILSHNDLCGINYCGFETKTGFDIEDICSNCSLFINGHLHNGGEYRGGKIINLGNLTGQNFNEDGFKYKHRAMVLDTATLKHSYIENPFAMNFYKIGAEHVAQALSISNPAVLSITCSKQELPAVRTLVENSPSVLECRVGLLAEHDEIEQKKKVNKVDYIAAFRDFVFTSIGKTNTIEEEVTLMLGR